MSKEIIDHGFGVIETRETFYTEETIRQKDQKIADLEAKLELHEQSNKVLNDQLNKATEHMSELEDKLAESEKQANDWKQRFESEEKRLMQNAVNSANALVYKQKKIKELKQQLTEQKLLADNIIKSYVEANKSLSEQLLEKEKLLRKYAATSCPIYQDKISFAVEKLEQIKKFLYSGYAVDNEEIEKEIDNQINELKKEK